MYKLSHNRNLSNDKDPGVKRDEASKWDGLSEEEARQQLARYGANELPSVKPKSQWRLLLSVLREPMVLLLFGCAVLYLTLGDIGEGILLASSILLLIGIGFYQQSKSEKALYELRSLASPRALVIRDGAERRIPGRNVVPGDLLILREGDRIPADCELLESHHLKVDESLLTGESLPVEKKQNDPQRFLFSATLVIAGKAIARVQKTGRETEVGKIGKSIEERAPEPSYLEKEITAIIWRFGALGLGISILIVVSYGLIYQTWSQGFLAGLAAAMSLLPEEFPLVLTLFLSMGAWRISKKRVLAREIRAIETLGSITALCVDKTGTLTKNQMELIELRTPREQSGVSEGALSEEFHELIEFGALASHIDAFDPMDRAIRNTLEEKLAGTEHVHKDWKLIKEYPLSPELMAISCVWKSELSKNYVISSKGAPEAIGDLCHLDRNVREKIFDQVRMMSQKGLRVLAVARASFPSEPLPSHPHHFDFQLVGLLGLQDPLREEVPQAINECREAGIRVIMCTGDHVETARSIAKAAGFSNVEKILSGPELEQMNDLELQEQIKNTSVFARVVPNHKLRIINALRANSEIVAMTGDGVNDAPALKWAHVGISMGKRGTDVAREASDLVLLDDDFSSIVDAIRMGRRIFENITKAMSYIFAIHVPIAGLAILPVILKFPLILLPAHIVFLELIIDPASTLIFEAEREDERIMKQPPRKARARPFGWKKILAASAQGSVVLLAAWVVLLIEKSGHSSDNQIRASVFATLVLGNLGLIFVNRGPITFKQMLQLDSNPIAKVVLFGAVILLLCVIYVPGLTDLFQVSRLGLGQWGLSLALSALAMIGATAIRS